MHRFEMDVIDTAIEVHTIHKALAEACRDGVSDNTLDVIGERLAQSEKAHEKAVDALIQFRASATAQRT